MREPRKPGAWTLAGAVVIVGLGLLACKKSGSDATPSATPAPPASEAPAASVEPEPTASAEPAASASAEPAEADKTPVKVVTKTDAGVVIKDAGVPKDAAVADAATSPASSAADVKAINTCCANLAAESKKPGMNANKYKSAASVCAGIAASVKKGTANASAARTLIRAQLQGVPVPGGC